MAFPVDPVPALRFSDEDEPCRRTEKMGAVGHSVRDGGLQRAEVYETVLMHFSLLLHKKWSLDN